jgi:hypothetical protein
MANVLIDADARATPAHARQARPSSAPTWSTSGPGTAAPWPRAWLITRAGRPIAKDALARRFRDNEDMILRFAADLARGFTSDQAERDVRPVKLQQRASSETWHAITGMGGFAAVRSWLSTADNWCIDALDALIALYTSGRRLPRLCKPRSGAIAAQPSPAEILHAHQCPAAPQHRLSSE